MTNKSDKNGSRTEAGAEQPENREHPATHGSNVTDTGQDDEKKNSGPEDGVEETGNDIPFADLVEETERFESTESIDSLAETAFVEVDVDEVDPNSVWDAIEGRPSRDRQPAEPERRVVPKREYCHRCEHFSDPPEVACTFEGTRILELVDVNHFRVENCPIVFEREREGRANLP